MSLKKSEKFRKNLKQSGSIEKHSIVRKNKKNRKNLNERIRMKTKESERFWRNLREFLRMRENSEESSEI